MKYAGLLPESVIDWKIGVLRGYGGNGSPNTKGKTSCGEPKTEWCQYSEAYKNIHERKRYELERRKKPDIASRHAGGAKRSVYVMCRRGRETASLGIMVTC